MAASYFCQVSGWMPLDLVAVAVVDGLLAIKPVVEPVIQKPAIGVDLQAGVALLEPRVALGDCLSLHLGRKRILFCRCGTQTRPTSRPCV
jgi:hypothetical protein